MKSFNFKNRINFVKDRSKQKAKDAVSVSKWNWVTKLRRLLIFYFVLCLVAHIVSIILQSVAGIQYSFIAMALVMSALIITTLSIWAYSFGKGLGKLGYMTTKKIKGEK
ncbi:hypothetical protein [Salinicola rhizosphaerae]|uniref:Uncharacterized protein n=1 Tax=Salinicola rhizosphaerae TaxID=1443141 RepID=A0ABQ3DTZ5_9GAMM|nr:hypothetical protein [Salinicola rhizosphaerae]GHB12893.1 hypothetical protein GCM10009038_08650 [Salinicola rhizosphaerae]